MFGTLRYKTRSVEGDSETGEISQLHSAHATAGVFPLHAACERCKLKKLRCDGRKSGCKRCKTATVECVYPQSSADGRRQRTRTASQSMSFPDTNSPGQSTAQPVPSPISAQPMETCPSPAMRETVLSFDQLFPDDGSMPMEPSDVPEHAAFFNHNESWSAMFLNGHEGTGHDIPALPPLFQTPELDMATASIESSDFSESDMDVMLDYTTHDMLPMVASPTLTNILQYSSNTSSPGADKTQSSTPANLCSCVQVLAMLLEQLAGGVQDMNRQAFDSIMAYVRDAVGRCAHVVSCGNSAVRPDHSMLLAIVLDRLIELIAKVAEASNAPVPGGKGQMDSYELSHGEYAFISRALLGYQLGACHRLVVLLRERSQAPESGSCDVQSVMLVKLVEQRLAKVRAQLGLAGSRSD